jgi:hypothetical protein
VFLAISSQSSLHGVIRRDELIDHHLRLFEFHLVVQEVISSPIERRRDGRMRVDAAKTPDEKNEALSAYDRAITNFREIVAWDRKVPGSSQ